MKIGVRLPASGVHASPENLVKVATWAQELGFASVWVNDHVILPDRDSVESSYPYAQDHRWPVEATGKWFDPLLALAWAGAAAPDVQLGISVLVLPMRNPVLLAKQAATLDQLTGGRLLLGIGIGWMKEEFDLVDADFEHRGGRAEEMVEVMRALWTGERAAFDGRYLHLQGGTMQPPTSRGGIPILWGGENERTLRRVARLGDGWHPLGLSVDDLNTRLTRLRELCREYGRDPASLLIVGGLGGISPGMAATEENFKRLEDLGVGHIMAPTPSREPDLSDTRAELERLARIGGLVGRR